MECLITIIQFIFITRKSQINPRKLKISLNLQGEEYELNEESQLHFKARCPSSKIYYGESITLWYENKEICTFNFLIYINKRNTIIFDLDEFNKPSFELFFYVKESKYNPTHIQYKGANYSQLENYDNKYRSRIFFANIDPSQLEYINSPSLKEKYDFENNTYQAIFRIVDNEKFEVSLTDMKCYVYDYNEIKYEKLSDEQLLELQKLLFDFNEKFWKFIHCDLTLTDVRKKFYDELMESTEKITSNDCYYFLDAPKLNNYEYYSNDVLYLFHLDYFLNVFLEINQSGKAIDVEKIKAIQALIYEYDKLEEDLYIKLDKDNNLNIEQKIRIMKTITLFFKKCLSKGNTISGVSYINMGSLSENSPYFKSRELLLKIINEITEDSRLFEAFLYFDSEVIENILTENTELKYTFPDLFGKQIEIKLPKYTTEYGISLMTVDEIKENLINILPEIIVQIDANINMRAMFENETKLMIINEYIMFGNLTKNNEVNVFKNDPDYYVIPISIEILHEILGHAKIRYRKDIEEDRNYDYSPLVVRMSKYDFKPIKIMRRIKLFDNSEIKINKGETGRVLEYYISEDPEVIQMLKRRSLNTELINSKYWTGNNFDLLHKALHSEFKKDRISNVQEILWGYFSDEQHYSCLL